MLMGTFSITLSIVIIDPQKSTIPITLPLLMTQISYIFISLLITGKIRYPLLATTQFLAAICPHFHYPFIIAESKQLLDFQ